MSEYPKDEGANMRETRPEMLYTGTGSPQDEACELVRGVGGYSDHENIYVVWFAKVLQNWKALVSTDVMDYMYFEVSYNGVKHETYVDMYKKVTNTVVPD